MIYPRCFYLLLSNCFSVLRIRRYFHLHQYLLIVKYRLVGADTDKVFSEHVKQVGSKGKRRKGAEEFFAVAKEGVEYRKNIISSFVESAAAGMVDYDGVSAGK